MPSANPTASRKGQALACAEYGEAGHALRRTPGRASCIPTAPLARSPARRESNRSGCLRSLAQSGQIGRLTFAVIAPRSRWSSNCVREAYASERSAGQWRRTPANGHLDATAERSGEVA